MAKKVELTLEEIFEAEEKRKDFLYAKTGAKNKYLLENKRFAFWDLETTNLNASIGRVLAGCVWDGTTMYSFDNWKNDRKTCVRIRNILEEYDYVVSYNGYRFDVPYLNTRLIKHGERKVKPIRHIDPIWTARSHLRLHSNRMEVVGQTLKGVSAKTKLDGDMWELASVGDKEAMRYVVEHCEADCHELADIFYILAPFINIGAARIRGAYI